VRVTHPFHPLTGQEFGFAFRRSNWGEDRVFVFTAEGGVRSFPAGWTDAAAADPFVVMAAGRSPFRVQDLLALAGLLQRLRSAGSPGRKDNYAATVK
jgi:Family of unknown function (DUF5372)